MLFRNQNDFGSNVVLIGFQGSGKTTVGKLLSSCLNYQFVDTDLWIENHEKKTVFDIFQIFGELEFRRLEKKCLRFFFERKKISTVFSTGGGMVLSEENCKILRALGVVVWLKVDCNVAWDRFWKGNKPNPLLSRNKGWNHAKSRLEALYEQRRCLYERLALISVDGNESPDVISRCVMHKLSSGRIC